MLALFNRLRALELGLLRPFSRSASVFSESSENRDFETVSLFSATFSSLGAGTRSLRKR